MPANDPASPQSAPPQSAPRRRILGAILSVIFVVALIMGPGPGMLLINRPQPLLGLPALYAWGLGWYVVEVGVVVLAYWFVWPHNEERSEPSPPDPAS